MVATLTSVSKLAANFSLLPHKPPYRLALDRTNWKFGSSNINILVIAIVYQGDAFPLLFKMMPKFGNSSTNERIGLMVIQSLKDQSI